MAVAGDIVANLTANTKGWSAGFQNAGGTLTAFAGLAATAGGIIAGALGFGAIIEAASNTQETMNKFNVVFGENAEQAKRWGDAFAEQVGRSDRQVADFLAGSQDLFVPIGFDAESANKLSQTLVTLAIDLASFNNLTDEQTYNDLQAALTGSGEVMKKYGVIVSEAAVKQQLLNEGINPASATEAQKVQARMNIILAGTTAAQGDAIRSADGWANQLKRLTGTAENLAASLGQQVLPAVTKVLSGFILAVDKSAPVLESLFGVMGHVLDIAADWSPLFLGAAAAIATVIVATKTFALVTLAAASAQKLMLALSGPAGWAVLALGIGVAAAATVAMKSEYDAITSTTDKVADSHQTATQAVQRHAAAQDDLNKRLQDANKVHEKLNRMLLTPAQQAIDDARKLGEEWMAANKVGSTLGMRFEELDKLQRTYLEDKSGFSVAFADVTDELRVLRGEITETELKFQQMAEFGVSDRQIQKLREANAERDRLIADQREKEDATRETDGRVKSTVDMVGKALETPMSRFLDKARDVEEAVTSGALSSGAGQRFLSQERQKMLDEAAANKPEDEAQRKAAITEAISVRSDAGSRQLVELLNRKGGGNTSEAKTLAWQAAQKKLAEDTLAVLEDVKENTAKPQMTTRPWGART